MSHQVRHEVLLPVANTLQPAVYYTCVGEMKVSDNRWKMRRECEARGKSEERDACLMPSYIFHNGILDGYILMSIVMVGEYLPFMAYSEVVM